MCHTCNCPQRTRTTTQNNTTTGLVHIQRSTSNILARLHRSLERPLRQPLHKYFLPKLSRMCGFLPEFSEPVNSHCALAHDGCVVGVVARLPSCSSDSVTVLQHLPPYRGSLAMLLTRLALAYNILAHITHHGLTPWTRVVVVLLPTGQSMRGLLGIEMPQRRVRVHLTQSLGWLPSVSILNMFRAGGKHCAVWRRAV